MATETSAKLLVSACLLGDPVRYDGASKAVQSDLLQQWYDEGRIVSVCPELAGGLPVPRPQAEIQSNASCLKVVAVDGSDVTDAFLTGAQAVLKAALANGCRFALLSAKSPSCGNELIYDGTFSGQLIEGQGITARLLTDHGIRVFNQFQIDELATAMDS